MRRRQAGIALITAILVVALASIAAAAMLSSANLAVHRASTLSDTERAWWYADGIEQWVKSILILDQQNSKDIDHLGEAWAKRVDYIPVDEGSLRGGISDLQGRFNLNNLSLKGNELEKYKAQFQRLVQSLEGLQGVSTDGLADAIHDWMDNDDVPSGFGGAEDSEYSSLQPPYRTANRQMTSATELLAVRGVTREVFQALRPHVTALPVRSTRGTPINVNTATLPVLLSMAPQPAGTLGEFVSSRAEKPADNADKFWADYFAGQDKSAAPAFGVSTEYFLLEGEAFIGSSRLALYSVMYRPSANGLPAVLSRSQDLD